MFFVNVCGVRRSSSHWNQTERLMTVLAETMKRHELSSER